MRSIPPRAHSLAQLWAIAESHRAQKTELEAALQRARSEQEAAAAAEREREAVAPRDLAQRLVTQQLVAAVTKRVGAVEIAAAKGELAWSRAERVAAVAAAKLACAELDAMLAQTHGAARSALEQLERAEDDAARRLGAEAERMVAEFPGSAGRSAAPPRRSNGARSASERVLLQAHEAELSAVAIERDAAAATAARDLEDVRAELAATRRAKERLASELENSRALARLSRTSHGKKQVKHAQRVRSFSILFGSADDRDDALNSDDGSDDGAAGRDGSARGSHGGLFGSDDEDGEGGAGSAESASGGGDGGARLDSGGAFDAIFEDDEEEDDDASSDETDDFDAQQFELEALKAKHASAFASVHHALAKTRERLEVEQRARESAQRELEAHRGGGGGGGVEASGGGGAPAAAASARLIDAMQEASRAKRAAAAADARSAALARRLAAVAASATAVKTHFASSSPRSAVAGDEGAGEGAHSFVSVFLLSPVSLVSLYCLCFLCFLFHRGRRRERGGAADRS